MGSMSQEELISWLYQLIDHELDKPEEETDNALIAECSFYLEELQDMENEFSEAEILSRLEEIKKQVVDEKTTIIPGSIPVKKKNHRLLFKVFIPIAAVFSALVLTLSAVATANGTTLGKFLSENYQKISRMSKGEKYEDGGITVIKASGKTTYRSVDDFLDQENLNILFPQPLPSGISIEFIQIDHLNETHTIIAFLFEGKDIQMTVRNTYQMKYNAAEYSDKMTVGDITYYVYPSDNSFLISAQYNGYEYTLESSNFDLLKQFITNMKEFKK